VEGQDHTPAVSVIVMSKAEIAQHQEKSRDEWQKRGAAGKVKSLDAAAKSITVSMQAAAGLKDIVVETDGRRGSGDTRRTAYGSRKRSHRALVRSL